MSAVLAAYSPALDGQFLWDDVFLVRKNLLIRSPLCVLEVFRHTLFNNESNFYRPTQTLTFLANYWFWGFNPFGYHLTSILIQGLNAFLLFLVLRGVVRALLPEAPRAPGDEPAAPGTPALWIAFGVALLWAVHPVHSAAVAYISGSADSLAMLFCLAAWLACDRALAAQRTGKRIGFAILASICLLAGLCSKEIAGIWLALYLIYLFVLSPGRDSRRLRMATVGLSLVVIGLYLGLRHLPPPGLTPPPSPPMPAKWLLMLRALGDYGSLMLYPKELFMERQVFAAPGLENAADEALYLSLAVAGVGMLAGFAAGAWWPGSGRRLRQFGAVWFLLGFLPISNLFSLNATVAEHWLYLPSIGFLLFVAGVVVDLPWRRFGGSDDPQRSRPLLVTALVFAIVLPAAALGIRTWYRSFDWLDELSFYQQTLHAAGDVPRARVGLAMSLTRQHNDAGAIVLLREVIAKYPRVPTPRLNLAAALLRRGEVPEAKSILEKVAAEFPGHDNNPREIVAAVDNLDKVEGGNPAWPAQRAALLDDATRRHPDLWELVLIRIRQPEGSMPTDDAVARVRLFVKAHWWHSPAWYQLGCMQAARGDYAGALAAFHQAARLDVHDDTAFSASAAICEKEARLPEAIAFQQRAVSRRPDSPQLRFLYARLLEQNGESAKAGEQLAAGNDLLRLLRH